jgi:hypothetical protein
MALIDFNAPYIRYRPRPHTDDMRAMVDDLRERGEYTRTFREIFEDITREFIGQEIKRIVEDGSLFQTLFPHGWNFHRGGLVKGPSAEPGNTIQFGGRGPVVVHHAAPAGHAASRIHRRGGGAVSVTLDVGRDGKAE